MHWSLCVANKRKRSRIPRGLRAAITDGNRKVVWSLAQRSARLHSAAMSCSLIYYQLAWLPAVWRYLSLVSARRPLSRCFSCDSRSGTAGVCMFRRGFDRCSIGVAAAVYTTNSAALFSFSMFVRRAHSEIVKLYENLSLNLPPLHHAGDTLRSQCTCSDIKCCLLSRVRIAEESQNCGTTSRILEMLLRIRLSKTKTSFIIQVSRGFREVVFHA